MGWLRAIRETLGMTSAALGQRLGITASGVRKLERAGCTMALETQLQEGRMPLAQPIPRQALVVPEAAEVPGSDGNGIGGQAPAPGRQAIRS